MDRTEFVPSIPKYLEDELSIIAKNHQFLEYTIQLDNGSKHGDGFMATMVGVTLRGQQYHNGLKMNFELPLICKLLPDSIERRETFSAAVLFEREVFFYKTVLPIFIKFLEDRNINVHDEFSMYPKCFVTLYEPQLDHHLIIMENLRSSGYDMWPKTVPIDFDAAAGVLTELGKFHAISLGILDQRREIFDDIFRLSEPFRELFKGNGATETMVSGAIQETIDVLEDETEIAVMQTVKDNYESWFREYLSCDAAGRFSVLNHGDLWNNNMMFNLKSNRQQLRFVDFQLLRLASPVLDITYYICSSTTQEIHQRFNDLLKIYYDALATFLTKMGSDPNKLFTFNDLQDQFRQFGKYGLIFTPILAGVMVSESKDIIDMDSIKQDTAVAGLAVLNQKTKMLLKNRMSSVIQLAIEQKWV
ncbi:uncharacterized protein LOC119085779 [Bradysia coprophila]|uniref:uncharacterized protein LOC119085779 n=1 Tax=Bradysia coprophila TaxID=38358 RepID=UPI00187D96A7|nr:uncharacterized protein LOC119085779 [Bradysia coprophila]